MDGTTAGGRTGWRLDDSYVALTSELLSTLKKTEDSLLRLKRTKKKAGAGDGTAETPVGEAPGASPAAMTDENKIRQQLWLDVKQYAAEVRRHARGQGAGRGQAEGRGGGQRP